MQEPEFGTSLPSAFDFSAALDRQLSARQRRRSEGLERVYSRKQIEQAFLETFELVGGIPRLALWANEPQNYGTFVKLLTVFAPKEQLAQHVGNVIEYRSNIPASPLNGGPAGYEGEITDVESGG